MKLEIIGFYILAIGLGFTGLLILPIVQNEFNLLQVTLGVLAWTFFITANSLDTKKK